MIHYRISFNHPHRQYIDLEATFPNHGRKNMLLQLPAWRPGRYELGNFASQIRSWKAYDQDGSELKAKKIGRNLWQVESDGLDHVTVHYDFYANTLNAGSTWVEKGHLYINPVNCFFYLPEDLEEKYTIHLDLPGDWKIACGLSKADSHTLQAEDYQQVMDCPMIASPDIAHLEYNVEGVRFHIWIQGEVFFDIERFVSDHKSFTEYQIAAFGDIPCEEYHFLYEFPDFLTRHGVEHENSTVITFGPAERLQNESDYLELLGISCHELYHTWNVKSIRPVEMMPYDFSTENYSRLGYVAEGVTTYFGDQFLLRCGVFDEEEYFRRLALQVERHLNNPGRFNLSVAESSFDTWIDGYTSGIPGRKVSIYNEGSLAALITDVHLLDTSNGQNSLDDAMRSMYENYGKISRGYSEDDYRTCLEQFSGATLHWLFDELIYNATDYTEQVERSLARIGLLVERHENGDSIRARLGMLINGQNKVVGFLEDSPADASGIMIGDILLTVDGDENISEKKFRKGHNYVLGVRRFNKEMDVRITGSEETYYDKITIRKQEEVSETTSLLYTQWRRS